MQARCPSCQNLFTTDRLGLQFCTACGRQVSVAGSESTSLGDPGVPTAPEPTPWERRESLGVVAGYIQTWRRVMFSPEPFWRTVRPDGPWLDAFYYGWITSALTVILALPLRLLSSALTSESGLSRGRDLAKLPPALRLMIEAADAHPGISWPLMTLFGVLVMVPVGLMLGAAIMHALSLLFGEGKKGFWATFRVFAYAASPNLLSFIPCAGLVSGMYVMVQEVLGLKHVQGIKTEKAAAIVCIPLLFACCCVGAILASVGGALFGMSRR